MSHYVYILRSLKDDRYYDGETTDEQVRLLIHNAGKQRSKSIESLFGWCWLKNIHPGVKLYEEKSK